MESPLLEEFFAKQWTAVTKSCAQRMEPYDRRTIGGFRNYEDVQEHVFGEQDEETSQAALQELAMMRPRLVDLKDVSEFFATRLHPTTFDTSMFWGLLCLLLRLALQQDEATRQIVQMLKKLSRNCHIFVLHTQHIHTVTNDDKEACFDIFLTITTFLADAVQFLRETDAELLEPTYGRGRYHDTWAELNDKFSSAFSSALNEVEDTLNRVERVAARYQRPYRSNTSSRSSWSSYVSLSPRASYSTAQLPCFVLPPNRTSRFFNREDVLESIETHFQNDATSLRSLALYGMGGIGKSHVAMKYLEKKQMTKEFDGIFWVNAETPNSIQQSFTDISLRLKLPDTGPATHDENRMILKEWLQQTKCKWIVVYDNAETIELLQDYWPLSGSNGCVLITTRNHTLGFDPADTGIEVLPWDTDTGSKFLLHLLADQISADLLASETQSARSLSERLGGHALALSNMCCLLHRRSWSISELVEAHDRSEDFKYGLETVWQLSFESLQPDCAALLSAFAFCAPNSIPQSLFEFDDQTESLTDDMLWYLDSERLLTATEELLALALIKRDRYDRVFSIHRLISKQFLRFLSPAARQRAFFEASILMYNVFPKRPKKEGVARANLYNTWDKCQLWLPHVLQLKSSFMQERQRDPDFMACKETCETWVQCQRFLLETQNWRQLEDLVTVNKLAMATLSDSDKQIYLLSSTEIHISSMWAFRSRFQLALDSLLEAYRLKVTESPPDIQNIAWIEDNLATIYGCLADFDTAATMAQHSQETWERWSKSTDVEFVCPPLLKLTHGRILAHAGRLEEARVLLTEALDGFLAAEPFVWAPTAICKFTIGRLLMFKEKYDAAERMLLECQSMWLRGDKSRALDFNGVIVYQLGCCALMRGGIDSAVTHLQESKAICSIHQDAHPAKYARCLFKLSQALRQGSGRDAEEKADLRLKEARELYFGIVGTSGSVDEPTEECFDALIHISQR